MLKKPSRRSLVLAGGLLSLVALLGGRASLRAQASDDGWQIPPTAASEASPVAANDKTLARGKDIFKSKCQRCHGPSGQGDGPDADKKHKPGNLSDGSRASRNPDGVMFYKLWNGRANPKMPAFKSELSREDIWTVIAYAKTLRQ